MDDSVFDVSTNIDSRLQEVYIPRDRISLGKLVGKGQWSNINGIMKHNSDGEQVFNHSCMF